MLFKQQSPQFDQTAGIRNISDFRRVAVVPTYRTNAILNSQLNPWPPRTFLGELKLENFYWIVDRLQNIENLQTIFFSGGEPTVWEHLDPAIYYARKHKIKIVLYTNGVVMPRKSLPDRVIIPLHTYLDHPKLRLQIAETINLYLNKGVPVDLKYFKRKDDDAEAILLGKNLAEKSRLPLEILRGYSDPERNCDNCTFCQFAIQPDGDTVSLCKFLPFTAKLSEHLSLTDLYAKEFLPKLKNLGSCRAKI